MFVVHGPGRYAQVHQQGPEKHQSHSPARRLDGEIAKLGELLTLPLFFHERNRGVHDGHQIERAHVRSVVAKLDLELLDFRPREHVAPLDLATVVDAERDDELILVAALPELLLEHARLERLVAEDENEDPHLLGPTELGVGDPQDLLGLDLRRIPVAENRLLAVEPADGWILEQMVARSVEVRDILEVEDAAACLHAVLVRVLGEHRLEGLIAVVSFLIPLGDVLVAVFGVIVTIELYAASVAEAIDEFLVLALADRDRLAVAVLDLPDRRMILDVVVVLFSTVHPLGLGRGPTFAVRDRDLLVAVLGVGTRYFFIPALVVFGDLDVAAPVLGV